MKGAGRQVDKEYKALSNQMAVLSKRIQEERRDSPERAILLEEKHELHRQRLKISSRDQHDPNYRRLYATADMPMISCWESLVQRVRLRKSWGKLKPFFMTH